MFERCVIGNTFRMNFNLLPEDEKTPNKTFIAIKILDVYEGVFWSKFFRNFTKTASGYWLVMCGA